MRDFVFRYGRFFVFGVFMNVGYEFVECITFNGVYRFGRDWGERFRGVC